MNYTMVDYPDRDTVIRHYSDDSPVYHFDKAVWQRFMEKGDQPMEQFPVHNDTLRICLLWGLCESSNAI